jgi:hypothetical protein
VNLQLLRSALLFQDIFDIGVCYLRRAGKDVCEFAREENLALLRDGEEGIMTSLFLVPERPI